MTRKEQIIGRALELLDASPEGIKFSTLVSEVQDTYPDIPKNTIHGNLWDIHLELPDQVAKPDRGLFMLVKYLDVPPTAPPPAKISEEMFYQPFADWLKDEVEECTRAIPLGGNAFGSKWGTPDVVGVREPRKSDIVKFPTEIVSAEVKLDPLNLITAFGQACSYKLFSHKSYIVVPTSSPEQDIARLDSLARIFGIGLVLFDPSTPKEPEFQIRVRASRHEPDMFYVNQTMRIVEDGLFN